MNRLIALVAALLCSFLAFSQEASSGNSTELTIVPRFDVNPIFPLADDGQSGVNFGNSSLTSLLEGTLGDRFSYSVCNLWANTDTRSLYDNTFCNDEINWLLWANVTASLGNFDFTVGKDVMKIANMEEDMYDFDMYSDLASNFWNVAQVYQWGGSVAYNFGEESQVGIQVTTSPFNHKFYDNNLMTVSLFSREIFGNWDLYESFNVIGSAKSEQISILSLGSTFDNGSWNVSFNAMAQDRLGDSGLGANFVLNAKAGRYFGEKTNVFVKGGFESCNEEDFFGYGDEYEYWGIVPSGLIVDKAYAFCGAGAEWYPSFSGQNLRIHAVAAVNNFSKSLSLNIGATYFLNFSK